MAADGGAGVQARVCAGRRLASLSFVSYLQVSFLFSLSLSLSLSLLSLSPSSSLSLYSGTA